MHAHRPSTEALRRPAVVIALHWATVVALLLGLLIILLREEMGGRALRYWMLEAHRHIGLLVLWLLFIRLAVRLTLYRFPAIDQSSRLARAAAAVTHVALYLLLAAVPLLGWALSNAHGHTLHFFGIPLPTLVTADDDLGDTLHEWHSRVAWSLLALGLVHAAAALWHHLICRDRVLVAMLPQWPRRRAPVKD